MAAVQIALPLESRQEQVIPMTYEEYLTAFDEMTQAEWVNGEAIVFMPPNVRHQRILRFLFHLLGHFVQYRQLGELFPAPFAMRLAAEGSVREPDILFVAREHRQRVTEQRLEGPADLIVEIISPESTARDRSDKFYEYQQAGVREYWVVDPRPGLERADFWVLDNAGKYRPVPPDSEGIYHSTVLPGFWLNTQWLWPEEMPNPFELSQQILHQTSS
jgi:Uma2 family endonuclease